jgi:16S rRNA (uracil1498-N3)-methyltransferase
LRTFFVHPDRVFDKSLLLEREDGHHIRDVLRLKIGDRLQVTDGVQRLFQATIQGYPEGQVLCSIQMMQRLPLPDGPKVTLLHAIPKGKRMDWLIQKTTEAGVHALMPVIMERSERVPASDKADRQKERWQRIVDEACKQSGRLLRPTIHEPSRLEQAVINVQDFPLRVYFQPSERETALRSIHLDFPEVDRIALVVGPEGGFTAEEEESFVSLGFVKAALGDLVLRVETAGVLAVALVRYEWGQTVS